MLENNTNLARKQRQHFLVQVRRHRLAERTGKVAENHEIPIRQIGAPFLSNRIVGSNGNGLRIADVPKLDQPGRIPAKLFDALLALCQASF